MGLKHIGIAVAALLPAAGCELGAARRAMQATAMPPDAATPDRRGPATSMSCRRPITIFSPAPSPRPPKSDWVNAHRAGQSGPGHGRPPASAMALCAGPQQRRQIRRHRRGVENGGGLAAAHRFMPAPKPPSRRDMSPAADRAMVRQRARPPPQSAASGWAKRWSASGDKTRGAPLIRQGWSDGSFDDFTEAGILAQDAAYLTPESDRARLDALLWRNEIAAGAAADDAGGFRRRRRLAQARIALAAGLAHGQRRRWRRSPAPATPRCC